MKTKSELIEESKKNGFETIVAPGCPVWFIDIIQNQNIMLYLLTQNK